MKKDFNKFRFGSLCYHVCSNKYLTMDRVSPDETKIVVKVSAEHLIETRYGYALILDYSHVVFLKEWQVDRNWFGNEVLLHKDFWNVKEWGEHHNFTEEPQNLNFETWVNVAKAQNSEVDEDGLKNNPVKWSL